MDGVDDSEGLAIITRSFSVFRTTRKYFVELSLLLRREFFGFVSLSVPISPKLVFRHQTPKVTFLQHEKYLL